MTLSEAIDRAALEGVGTREQMAEAASRMDEAGMFTPEQIHRWLVGTTGIGIALDRAVDAAICYALAGRGIWPHEGPPPVIPTFAL